MVGISDYTTHVLTFFKSWYIKSHVIHVVLRTPIVSGENKFDIPKISQILTKKTCSIKTFNKMQETFMKEMYNHSHRLLTLLALVLKGHFTFLSFFQDLSDQ